MTPDFLRETLGGAQKAYQKSAEAELEQIELQYQEDCDNGFHDWDKNGTCKHCAADPDDKGVQFGVFHED